MEGEGRRDRYELGLYSAVVTLSSLQANAIRMHSYRCTCTLVNGNIHQRAWGHFNTVSIHNCTAKTTQEHIQYWNVDLSQRGTIDSTLFGLTMQCTAALHVQDITYRQYQPQRSLQHTSKWSMLGLAVGAVVGVDVVGLVFLNAHAASMVTGKGGGGREGAGRERKMVRKVESEYALRILSLASSPGLPRPKSQLWNLGRGPKVHSCNLGLGRPGDEATLS